MRTCNVLDISHHNPFTSLKGAQDAGAWGIIHKASESLSKDSTVAHRVPMIRDAGFLVGLYHFIRPGNVSKQVDLFLSVAKPLMDDDTLLCCDFEDAAVSLVNVLSFMEAVELKTGHSPVLYGGSILKEAVGADPVHAKKLATYRFWLAQYGPAVKMPKFFDKLWLWQYSEKGKIAGLYDPHDLNSHVDLDFFDGTQDELRAQWSGKNSGLSPIVITPNPADNAADVKPNPADEKVPSDNSTKVEVTDGNVKVETTSTPPAAKERVAVVKAVPQKWYQVVGAKIATFITGNVFFQWVWAQIETISSLKIPVFAWYAVSGIVVLGSLMWIIDAILDNHKANQVQKEIDQLLVTQNSTTDNLVQLIPANEVDLYRARGFKIITRGETAATVQSPVPGAATT